MNGVPGGGAASQAASGRRAAAAAVGGCGWGEAWRRAREAGGPVAAAVDVPLDAAVGTVLAEPLEALTDLPAFDTSAMDGWAVAGPGPWAALEAAGVLAGHAGPAQLPDGGAVPIATGARVPEGAAAVLRSEHGALHDGTLRPSAVPPAPGADIRPRGQECRAGDGLLPAGAPVTPPVLGLAAAAGYDTLRVVPAPRVEVLVLGDELLHAGRPHDGRVRDALGPMAGPWLTVLGASVTAVRRLPDDADALLAAVRDAPADLVVTTGGTASGPADHVHPVLRRLGARLLVHGVAVRPGHPMLLAELPPRTGDGHGAAGATHLVGLPGNPLAAVSGLLTLVAPLLRARAGRAEPPTARAALTADVPGHPRDTRLVPALRTAPREAEPLRYAGPAMLRGVAAADALAVVPPGGAPAGTVVRLLDLPW
jgi:molybdopterin molybdotransferase